MLETIIYYVSSISAERWVSMITCFGILAALFKREIIDFIWKPKLKISAIDNPKYRHIVPTNMAGVIQAHIIIEIINIGWTPAQKVQVFFSAIEGEPNKKFREFSGINLHKAFSNSKDTILERAIQKMPYLWNICFVEHNKFDPVGISKHPACLTFDLAHTPIYLKKLDRGEYIFEIIAVCENSKKRFREKFKLVFDGEWDDDQDVFFNKHLKIDLLENKKATFFTFIHNNKFFNRTTTKELI
ncbi:MAG: hypothetical protein KAU95_00765 [Candidatus Aenigmarchaeota archaeon]|nr:hypothetical protein [Candidatus Aenigmarchaeota archaeon]